MSKRKLKADDDPDFKGPSVSSNPANERQRRNLPRMDWTLFEHDDTLIDEAIDHALPKRSIDSCSKLVDKEKTTSRGVSDSPIDPRHEKCNEAILRMKELSRGVSDSPIELSDDEDDKKVMTQEEHNRHCQQIRMEHAKELQTSDARIKELDALLSAEKARRIMFNELFTKEQAAVQAKNAELKSLTDESSSVKLELSVARQSLTSLTSVNQRQLTQLQNLQVLSLGPILYGRYSRYYEEKLVEGSPAFDYIKAHFMKMRGQHRGPRQGDPHRSAPEWNIVSIERIHNPRLWSKYIAELDDISGLCSGSSTAITDDLISAVSVQPTQKNINPLNEFFLFHGVPSNLSERIAQQGLDPRYAGEHFGKLFGSGVYFAKMASKSDIYTKPNDGSKIRTMYLARVCLGEAHQATKRMDSILRPPERPDKRGPLNSVRALSLDQGGCVEFLEYIIYKDAQAYPEFRISYEHTSTCQCTHCVKV